MFEELKKFTKIILTGPQRAGTKISAKIIADELGYEYFQEQSVNISDYSLLVKLIESKSYFVIQCPGLAHRCHELAGFGDDLAVVFARRDTKDIIISQDRIKWTERLEPLEKEKYNRFSSYYTEGDPISVIKYKVWEKFQKRTLTNSFEVEYKSLSFSHLWIPEDKREALGKYTIN